ncbi:SUMO-activating enzyme subunit 1 [Vespa crabro]|uniref:SUMO-activating enzyme subunit 1 n=1 Tax=Vespa crabro TaxID=7445 RepID=UPI001F027F0D|nr:SUMO-activating enzyme subunit 1 [Vespa crabro]XP_046826132.1 SUMO-activating enzyme subunit 1 [Vespa crabro]
MFDDKNHAELTDAEAELYDRQIRLWGLESQKRLRSAKVLLIGLGGFGAEIAKNVILAGVKTITLLDHRNMTIEDTCSQFFIPNDQIGKNKAEASLQRTQNLNPMVNVEADSTNIDDKPDEYFSNFNVICATQCTITQLKRLNKICRQHKIKFFAGDVWGTFGYTFADLDEHEYVEDIVQTKPVNAEAGGEPKGKEKFEKIVITEKRKDNFVPFESIIDIDKSRLPTRESEMYYMMMIMLHYREKYKCDPLPNERGSEKLKTESTAIIEKYQLGDKINSLIEGDLYGQISPICAIVGGVMSQEIIKAVSQKEAPHNNVFLFNPQTLCGKILKLA